MLTKGQCIFDTSFDDEDGSLRTEARAAGGVVVRATAFRRTQEFWYPDRASAEAGLPEHEEAYRGASSGPAGLEPPRVYIID